jgi:hypothetical protein
MALFLFHHTPFCHALFERTLALLLIQRQHVASFVLFRAVEYVIRERPCCLITPPAYATDKLHQRGSLFYRYRRIVLLAWATVPEYVLSDPRQF